MTPWEAFIESGAALDAARNWLNDDHLLDAYLNTRQADTDFRQWCDEQIRERLNEGVG